MNEHTYTYQSEYHLWTAKIEKVDEQSVTMKVTRSLSGKRKGPKLRTALWCLSDIDPDTAAGQWMSSLSSSTYGGKEDPFVTWVKSFHKGTPTKQITVEFDDHTLVCDPGLGDCAIGVRKIDDTHTRLWGGKP